MKSEEKQMNSLSGWQLLLVGDAIVLVGALLGVTAFLGSAVTIIGHAVVLAAAITGIVRLTKKEHSGNPVLTVSMTILGNVLLVLFTSFATFVAV